MSDELVDAIAEMRDEEAIELARQLLDSGTPPEEVLEDCRKAMAIVGRRFEDEEYFIPELILAGETLRAISEIVKPLMTGSADTAKNGTIVLGTVQGDIHDIGKDIVSFMLDVNGFEVFDLGVDVPPESFVTKVREVRPEIVALSGFLTLSFDAMKETVEALQQGPAGRREDHDRRRDRGRQRPRVRARRRLRVHRDRRGEPGQELDGS